MLSLTGFQDVLNALLVIIIVSIIVAVAWLSTNVREQPLIATAVVVFQSGVNSEGDSNASATGAIQRENQGGGTHEGEMESVNPTPVDKENDSTLVEVKPESDLSPEECKSEEVSEDSRLFEQSSVVKKEGESGAEASAGNKDIAQSHSEDPTFEEHHNASDDELTNPSCTISSSSSSESVHDDASQEMEVRNRRLKHFVTMGGSRMQEIDQNVSGSQKVQDIVASQVEEGSKLSENSNEKKESNPSAGDASERPPGSIRIRLKFLDESQKYVFAQPTEQVGSFKRQHFSIEMDANRRIQLIFNGQLLSQDSSTLAHYGLFDNCVVHCHVSQPQQMGQNNGQPRDIVAHDDEDAYVTSLLAPLLYCVMVVMWYLRYEYSHLFNTMSTVILLFLTALLLISTYLLYITQNVPGSDSTAQISSHQLDTNSLL